MVLKKIVESKTEFINENIPFSRVLLIKGDKKEIVTRQEALKEAQSVGLDLICVAPDIIPPVCKLIDYQKYLFELSKKKKTKNKSSYKEISVSFNIEDNDLNTKLKRVKDWIEEGWVVKFSLVMAGKEKTHPELAYEKCQKIVAELQNQAPKIALKDKISKHLGTFYFLLYKKKQ